MFFQNPFDSEYMGVWVLGDRHHSPTFKCPPNTGRGINIFTSWNLGPYDLTGNDGYGAAHSTLSIRVASDPLLRNYAQISVNISAGAVSSSAVTANEIVANLNNSDFFSTFFTATVEHSKIVIRYRREPHLMRAYIVNGGAEVKLGKLGFNKRAGIAELPDYFLRHTVDNRFNYDDGVAMLVPLSHAITGNTVANPTVVTAASAHGLTSGQTVYFTGSNSSPTINGARVVTVTGASTFTIPVNVTTAGTKGRFSTAVEADLINNAVDVRGSSLGYSALTVQEDYQLLAGRSGLFVFRKNTVSGSNQITTSIEYPAGAGVGDLAKKIVATYTSTNTNPDTYVEMPYVLTAADLLTP
jgi:hypothetical protein